jgi:hypothetical protein
VFWGWVKGRVIYKNSERGVALEVFVRQNNNHESVTGGY